MKPSDFKRTKIIATIGPATNTKQQIQALIEAGVNGLRLNFSHGTHDERRQQIKWIRQISKQLGKPIAIIQDLQGPKIRLGDFEGVIPVETDQKLKLGFKSNYHKSGIIPVQYDLSQHVKPGETIYLYDGTIKTKVTQVRAGIIYLKALNDGFLIQRKGLNLPETNFGGQTFTAKDIKDLKFGANNDIDYVAISFVQTEEDIKQLRTRLNKLKSDARIIAKLETKSACGRLEQIVEATDALMIARGDLAYEISPEAVPLVQRDAISLCHKHAKQSIVATQMLISMVDATQPTRAEVSDISTAVILGADAVMLSDETAVGKYPIQAVKVMRNIARYNETHKPLIEIQQLKANHSTQVSICRAIVGLARNIMAAAIVAETRSGATAYNIASFHPPIPILAVTSSKRVAQQLSITKGVKTFVLSDSKKQATKLTQWLLDNRHLSKGDIIVTASGQYPGVIGTTDTIKVRAL